MTSVTYALPTASASILGGIKVGTGLAITNGVLSNTGSLLTNASLLTSGTLADARLSNNVPLLNATNSFSGVNNFNNQIIIAQTVGANLLQVNNGSPTGGGIGVGTTAIGSPGSVISPAFSAVQAAPATTLYGLISIGNGQWDGVTAGFFVGSASGTQLAINAVSGYSGNLVDYQIAGVSKASISSAGALTTLSASLSTSITGPILQANNTSTIGGGIAVGSTTIASAGAGKIAPGLSATQVTPATANYGYVSIGSGFWDGSTAGKFVGSANGTKIAINSSSGYTGNFIDVQLAGTARFSISNAGVLTSSGQVTATSGGFRADGNGGLFTGAFAGKIPFNGGADAAPVQVNPAAAANNLLVVRGIASQTGDLQRWTDNSNNAQFGIMNAGTGPSPIWALRVRAVANAESMAQAHVIGAATGKAFQIIDDAGTTLGWIPLYA